MSAKCDVLGDKADDVLGDEADDVLGDKADDILGDKADDVLGDKADDVPGDKADDVLGDKADYVLGDKADDVLRDKAHSVLRDKADDVLGTHVLDTTNNKCDVNKGDILRSEANDALGSKADDVPYLRNRRCAVSNVDDMQRLRTDDLLLQRIISETSAKLTMLCLGKKLTMFFNKMLLVLYGIVTNNQGEVNNTGGDLATVTTRNHPGDVSKADDALG